MFGNGDAVQVARIGFGLANRVVPDGEARSAAFELAEQIAKFPQTCMRNDRLSALNHRSRPKADALTFEAELGRDSLRAGASSGAARFAGGKGRSGEFGDI